MKTSEFLSVLTQYSDKHLLFEYRPGKLIAPGYHVTEIKNVTIDAVDCGAETDFWKETVIQLWESPEEGNQKTYMTADKALDILKKVDGIKPMEKEVEVKFEYGNSDFHTTQLYVADYAIDKDDLILKLAVEKTDCKAKETCGVPVADVSKAEACCAPGSGCC